VWASRNSGKPSATPRACLAQRVISIITRLCLNLIEMAGEGSALAKKYKIQVHHVAVTNLPEDYATRLTEMFPRM
jgi:hypothetical protein